MRYIIDEHVLQGILWDSEQEDTAVVIPDGVEALESYCLEADDSPFPAPAITDIVVPASVERIDADAFTLFSRLESSGSCKIHFRGTLTEWNAIDKGWSDNFGAYTGFGLENYTLYLLDAEGNEYLAENLIFPENIHEISACAFTGCNSLKTVEIRGRVDLGELAFAGCRNLERIEITGDGLGVPSCSVYEPWDNKPFDDRDTLEVILSDAAADDLIQSEELSLSDTAVRILLEDREETLGEILTQVQDLTDGFRDQYGLPADLTPIQLYREYLRITRYEDAATDQASFDDINGEDVPEDDRLPLPDGYHFDEEIMRNRTIREACRKMYPVMTAYRDAVRQHVEKAKTAEEPSQIYALSRAFPNLWEMDEDLGFLINDLSYEEDPDDPGAIDDPEDMDSMDNPDSSDNLIEGLSDFSDLLSDILDAEARLDRLCYDFQEYGTSLWNIDPSDGFVGTYREDANDLLTLCSEAVEALKKAIS